MPRNMSFMLTTEQIEARTKTVTRRMGFPDMTPAEFVEFFCASHAGCTPETEVNRIEFEYLDGDA